MGYCVCNFDYEVLKERPNFTVADDETENDDFWDGDVLDESVSNDSITPEEKYEMERICSDILEDEISYPDYESIKDYMRSLHSDGAINDKQYNYFLGHWEEMLKSYEAGKANIDWDGEELDEAHLMNPKSFAEKIRSDINIEDYKNSLVGKKFEDQSDGTGWEITKVKCTEYGPIRENIIFVRQDGDTREYIATPTDLKNMFNLDIDDLLPDDYDDGEDEEELNE